MAAKFALVSPAATVTDAGTATAPLLLARFTTKPLLSAGALNSTVQLSAVDPVMELFVQLSEVNVIVFAAAAPTPLMPTCRLFSPLALLVIVSWPLAAPVAAGLKLTVIVNVLLGLMLAGNWLWPATVNDCPLTFSCEITTGAEP